MFLEEDFYNQTESISTMTRILRTILHLLGKNFLIESKCSFVCNERRSNVGKEFLTVEHKAIKLDIRLVYLKRREQKE